jgi:hypothetical protein
MFMLDSDGVQLSVINTEASGTIFLAYQQN